MMGFSCFGRVRLAAQPGQERNRDRMWNLRAASLVMAPSADRRLRSCLSSFFSHFTFKAFKTQKGRGIAEMSAGAIAAAAAAALPTGSVFGLVGCAFRSVYLN